MAAAIEVCGNVDAVVAMDTIVEVLAKLEILVAAKVETGEEVVIAEVVICFADNGFDTPICATLRYCLLGVNGLEILEINGGDPGGVNV